MQRLNSIFFYIVAFFMYISMMTAMPFIMEKFFCEFKTRMCTWDFGTKKAAKVLPLKYIFCSGLTCLL